MPEGASAGEDGHVRRPEAGSSQGLGWDRGGETGAGSADSLGFLEVPVGFVWVSQLFSVLPETRKRSSQIAWDIWIHGERMVLRKEAPL